MEDKKKRNKRVGEYNKRHYDRIMVLVQKGAKEDVVLCAKQHDMSVSQLVVSALENYYGLDLIKSADEYK